MKNPFLRELMETFLKLSRSIVNSPDFNARRCGIWKSFFVEPKKAARAAVKVRLRGFLGRAFRRPVDESMVKLAMLLWPRLGAYKNFPEGAM